MRTQKYSTAGQDVETNMYVQLSIVTPDVNRLSTFVQAHFFHFIFLTKSLHIVL